ncbi:unnamed protein product [Diabrotica balteata]|uniref:Salivary secreted peptide n=1 Tax=Diabrotica balteata TaxID=107213 RepID=A0A9N9T1A0_DIABA|nr:unnamed protein product [Diabrotica balteata]
MAAKLAFFFTFFLVAVYIAQAAEIPKNEQTAEQTIDGTIDKLKAGFEEFVDKVANNDLVKKTAQGIKDLGETIQQKGKEAIDKLTAETKTR